MTHHDAMKHPRTAQHLHAFTALCARFQQGFGRASFPLLLACAGLLLLDCGVLRDYLARPASVRSTLALPEPADPQVPVIGAWPPTGVESAVIDPVSAAKSLAATFGILVYLVGTAIFVFDAGLRLGASLHRGAQRRLHPGRRG
jgi:hypothetical protein